MPDPFDSLPVIGRMSPARVADALEEIGETELAATLREPQGHEEGVAALDWFRGKTKPWQHTSHAFGFIAPVASASNSISISAATNVAPDLSLKSARVRVTLNDLRIASYPGGGTHRVLFDFSASNQTERQKENVHFNSTYRVREGERAAVVGYPIFLGLNVGNDGLMLRCYTVNVKNDDDEALLQTLEGDVFKAGLRLINTAQPAIAPLSGLAVALTRTLAQRHRNVPVQDFFLGLDFSDIAGHGRLARGTYVAVQIPESLSLVWDWNDWVYLPSAGRIVSRAKPDTLIPYNYVSIGIDRYVGD